MLRSRFEAVPSAFRNRLAPLAKDDYERENKVISTLVNLVMFAQSSLAFETSVNYV